MSKIAVDILHLAIQNNIEVNLVDDQLKLKFPKNLEYDKNIVQLIKDNKNELIDFLKINDKGATTQNKIIVADKNALGAYPLSFSQERLWFLDRLEGSVQYHMPAVFRFKGNLNTEALAKSIKKILERHQVLRTVFVENKGEVSQKVIESERWNLNFNSGELFRQDTSELEKYINTLVHKPFDLSKDFMLRATLIELGKEEFVLVAVMHHIASDGWSRSILVKEIVDLYASFDKGTVSQLPDMKLQYVDYAVWQRNYLQGAVLDTKLAYWKSKLLGVNALQLPTDFTRPAVWSTKGDWFYHSIDKSTCDALQALSKRQGSTLFMTLLAAFKVLMYRHSMQSDICVGTPIAGRLQKDLEDLIGFFANTLALRSQIEGNHKFTEFLEIVKNTTLEAYDHQDVPFERVVDEVLSERDLSRNPLFQVMFVMFNTPEVPEMKISDVTLSRELAKPTAKFDIQITVTENAQGLNLVAEYCTDLFKAETIERLMFHYSRLLQSIVQNPEERVGNLTLFNDSETKKLLIDFNGIKVNNPLNQTVVKSFEEQVEKTPNAIAVVFESQQLTFNELNQKSNQLAHYLIKQGVKTETLVPICLERSLEMLIGIFGILKAGGAYVPIDPQYPTDRINYILDDCNSFVVLSYGEVLNEHQWSADLNTIFLDKNWGTIAFEKETNPEIDIRDHHLAFLIYTSGSTGQPKGTMNEHGALYNSLKWAQDYYQLSAEDAILQKTTYCFDVSIWELMWPPMVGAKLVFAKPEGQKDTRYLKSVIESEKITTVLFVPSMLGVLLNDIEPGDCSSIKNVLCSGEALKPNHLEQFRLKLPTAEIHNLYGPTEAAIHVTHWKLDKSSASNHVLIGKPIANTNIYLLDENEVLAPLGGVGQIHIGGIQVARGYLNLDELTSEKFIKDPFENQRNAKLYKTGDLGRWLSDGNLEYLGRIDDQVKIRGFRIELGEVERALNSLEQVNTNCVVVRQDYSGLNKLVSYYVPEIKIIKQKEQELYLAQVANWKNLYETEYEQTEDDSKVDEEFNLIGWNDSFTSGPIPETQMKAWVDDIINRILDEKPHTILEIGCGTGLLYYQLAGKVEKYIGTDFSKSSIYQINQRINKGLRNYGPTDLKVAAAHEVVIDKKDQVDTIILNSVAQYFPGEDYMTRVIENCLHILGDEGTLILGDMRDFRLLRDFKARLQLNKMQHAVTLKEFNWAVDQELLKEEELCFDPEYFVQLRAQFPKISHIDIQWKQADYQNELSLYRYTVVIYLSKNTQIHQPKWLDWASSNHEIIINEFLDEEVAISNIPNPRLWIEGRLEKAFKNKSITQVGELNKFIEEKDAEYLEVDELFEKAKKLNYSARWFVHEDPLKINVVFEKEPQHKYINSGLNSKGIKTNLTNIPLFNDISLVMQKEIKEAIQQKLPEYMVPSDLIALMNIPLNLNGKIDRKFLSEREDKAVANRLNYLAASTQVETDLVEIWQDLLHLDRIGVLDNFFNLGGHSLLVIRMISSVRSKLGIELAIKDLFNYPTIQQLAAHIQTSLGSDAVLPNIELYEKPERIPLSYSQERLWFIDKLQGSLAFHLPAVFRIHGPLNQEILTKTFQTIIQRHETFRTAFLENDGEPYQHVLPWQDWKLQTHDASTFVNNALLLKENIQNCISKPFNLSVDYMIRVDLMVVNSDDHLVVITVHHIASDAWSLAQMVTEIVEIYKSQQENRPAILPELKVQYSDYSIWQRNTIQGELLKRKLAYWKNQLQDLEVLPLPTDFPRPAIQSNKGSKLSFTIDKQLLRKLNELSRKQGGTLFMTLLASFKILLHRYTGQSDICVGTSVAGRHHKEIENLMGFFVNLIALRSEINPFDTFTEVLTKTKQTTLAAYEHQDVPFEKVVDSVVKVRDMGHSPVFQVLMVLLNTPEAPKIDLNDLTLTRISSEHADSKYDISLIMNEGDQGISISLEYRTDLFKEQTMRRLSGHFQSLLYSVVHNPSEKIGKLSMLSKSEENQILNEFNHSAGSLTEYKTINELFEEQVKLNPDGIALNYEGETLTYTELENRSNLLATHLQNQGVMDGEYIAIAINRSAEMMVGILGILKAGGAYVPLDLDYPEARLRYMLEDTNCRFLLSNSSSLLRLRLPESVKVLNLNEIDYTTESLNIKNKKFSPTPDSLAYVIYTSGSTGQPKGVQISHANVVSLVKGVSYVSFNPDDKLLSTGSASFDATTFEYWGILLNGGTLVLCDENKLLENSQLKQIISTYEINKIWFTSGWFNQLLDADISLFKGLQTILVGGEKLSEIHISRFKSTYPEITLINGYGPTENTTFSLTYQIDKVQTGKSIPIGRPLTNRSALILDSFNQLQPIGVVGEIFLGGSGLSKGYLNNAELNREKFVLNPFPEIAGEKLYKTGDLGRWLEDGIVEFAGRTDEQVKIRGFRIELGEIESVLLGNKGVKNAVVIVKTDTNGTKRVVAYVVAEGKFDRNLLFEYLKITLPEYMIPSFIVEMKVLPLTPNGKVDRRALPEPEIKTEIEGIFAEPQTKTEKELTLIWKELLDLESIGINDNFFESGGDSLLAIRVISAIRKQIGAEIPISLLFEFQTIHELSKKIDDSVDPKTQVEVTASIPRPEKIPLAYSQERLWFIHNLQGSVQYHIPSIFKLKGNLNIPALEIAFYSLVNRHEVLRTVFQEDQGIPYQSLLNANHWKLGRINEKGETYSEDYNQKLTRELVRKPFDLTKDYMLRADLIYLANNEFILVVNIHHIATDGWSRSIMVKELVEFYNASAENREPQLQPLEIQFADFAIWQKTYFQDEILTQKMNYWVENLKGVSPLELPLDNPRPAVQSNRGAVCRFRLDKQVTSELNALSKKQGTTLYMTLLSVFKVLLHKYSGQDDICVGSPIAGRQQKELENLIGFFVGTLAMRTQIDAQKTFVELLSEVRSTTLKAFENQEVPFEKIVETVAKDRDLSRSPIFQVMFVLQNTPDVPAIYLGDVELKGSEVQYESSLFDMLLSMVEGAESIGGHWEYNADLFEKSTVERLILNFTVLLKSVLNNPESKIADLNVLAPEESNLLLNEFNNTAKPFNHSQSVIDMFEQQVLVNPDGLAIQFKEETYTYQTLNEVVNQLANYLITEHHITESDSVGVMLNRSAENAITMLAILKTGACYLPIDQDLPVSRIQFILNNASPKLVLSESQFKSVHAQVNGAVFVNLSELNVEDLSKFNPSIPINPDSLSFIIYTSGSTGNPKGVMQTHRTLTNLIHWDNEAAHLEGGLKILQFSSYAFDSSLHDVLFALSNGGCACIVSEETRMDFKLLADFIRLNGIEIVSMPFSALSNFIHAMEFDWLIGNSIKHIISTGEQLVVSRKLQIFLQENPGIRLHNFYGPSETHVVTAISYSINDKMPAHIPIGKPIFNTDIYILNASMQLVPIGVTGEIYIGGDNLATGYLKNETMTAERFIPHFNKIGQVMYKTGDLGRWLKSGNIEYLGRIDDQVKIRGFRIEIGEVENAIQLSEMVDQVVVMTKTDPLQGKRLVAYIVPMKGFEKEKLLNILRTLLPEYMIPAIWIELDKFPLTLNGKTDKKALPEPDLKEMVRSKFEASRNLQEEDMTSIWEELLGTKGIGIHDNFFELGGHSLLAMRVMAAVRSRLNVNLAVKEIFANPTIASLCTYMDSNLSQSSMVQFSKIDPKPEHIPLSFSQERLWFIDKLEGSIQYHLPSILQLQGDINIEALEGALHKLFERHEILRTVIQEFDGRGYQVINEAWHWKLNVVDFVEKAKSSQALKLDIRSFIDKPFDLANEFPMRCQLYQIGQSEFLFVIVFHHIASDAWSVSVLVNELTELYKAFLNGGAIELAPLAVQYADFAIWQRSYLNEDVLEKKLAYWKQKLDEVEPLDIPTDKSRPKVQTIRGASKGFKIDKENTEKLHAIGRSEGTSMFMTTQAALKILLHNYCSQQDICVGTSIANRPQELLHNMLGFFVNILALRDTVNPQESFTDFLKKVKNTTLEAYEHQDIPFEKIVDSIVKVRDSNRSPVFQVIFVFLNTPEVPVIELENLEIVKQPVELTTTKFELTITLTESSQGLNGSIQYLTDLFTENFIQRFIDCFKIILESIVENPEAKIADLKFTPESDKKIVLEQFSKSAIENKINESFVSSFEKQVLLNPDKIALYSSNKRLSYLEVNEKANQLAHQLIDLGVKAETLVPVYMERTADMIVALLGIAKAGAAYVPIDTDFPKERIKFILQDVNAKILVSDLNTSEFENITCIKISELNTQPKSNPKVEILNETAAYVIYTSGSTGNPKGVVVEHGSITDYINGLNAKIQIDQCKSFALVSSLATDLGNTVIYSSLMLGGMLHIFTKEEASNPEYLESYFNKHSIDCLKIVPSHWKALSFDSLLIPEKIIIFGGEVLPGDMVNQIFATNSSCQVINHYGPTETTIGKLLNQIDRTKTYEESVPIGKPFGNTEIYVLSENKSICPVGVPGELFIGGEGVSRAYLNNPELTAQKFIQNPFGSVYPRLYATGDKVKFLEDGQIQFLGRIDEQVKIRGYRIEPSEIERIIQQSGFVLQVSVVVSSDKQGNNRLCAYLIPATNYSKETLLDFIKEKLPEYMIPGYFVELEGFPMLASGKIDRKSLPDPETIESDQNSYVAPVTEVEKKLVQIWESILETEPIGINDDFFELGGHSLLAIRLVSAIRKAFNVEMPIGDIFDYPTIAKLIKQLKTDDSSNLLPQIAKVVPRPERIPLSFSQERLYFIDKLEGSVQYHISSIFRLKGNLNIAGLEYAIGKLIERHEILRTVITEIEGKAYQKILPVAKFQLKLTEPNSEEKSKLKLEKYVNSIINKPFNLTTDYLIRTELISIDEDDHLLVATLHHMASDGWSNSIIVTELIAYYEEFTLGNPFIYKELPVQYADYALWQRNYLHGTLLESKLSYWKSKLKDFTILELPIDKPRPALQSIRGAYKGFYIDHDLTEKLETLSKQLGTTMFMTLISTFKVLLFRYTGQTDIMVGTPVAGRQLQELEVLIGYFINTLALRTEIQSENSFIDLVSSVKTTSKEAFEHQDVPYEKVVEALIPSRDMSRSPLFQAVFGYHNMPDIPEFKLGEIVLKNEPAVVKTVKFELTLSVTQGKEGMRAGFEYCTDLFEESTIERMISHYVRILEVVCDKPNIPVSQIDLLNKDDRAKIASFNQTESAYPANASIVDLFENQVKNSPDATAIVFEGTRLSYQELNQRANKVANALIKLGIKTESLVPICLDRSIELMVGILGILKSGGAYLPIDTSYPKERIRFMLDETKSNVAITNEISKYLVDECDHILVLNESLFSNSELDTKNPTIQILPNNLAYVMFTSGSTGMPKGTMIEHRNVVSLAVGSNFTSFNSHDLILSTGSTAFDATTIEYWGMLLNGGSLVLCSEEQLMDSELLKSQIESNKITKMWFTSSWFNQLVDNNITLFSSLKTIMVGGEKLSAVHIQKMRATYPEIELINGYGPTENTTFSLTYTIKEEQITKAIPIGKPLSNRKAYILDSNLNLVPIGVAGEIYLAGAGLSRGYLNRDDLNKEKFFKSPFVETEKIYKTGDLGRWLPSGDIEYLGRTDDQVKIRGYRIELGEIEETILNSGLVSQCVIVAKEYQTSNRIVEYIVNKACHDKSDISNYLQNVLPEYMIPQLWVEMENLPLTTNGKIDKRVLPEIDIEDQIKHKYVAPQNEIEKKLVKIWEEILEVDPIGVYDNFFELGGHSLLAIRMIFCIERDINLKIPIQMIFNFEKISDLARYIETELKGNLSDDNDKAYKTIEI